MEKRGTVDWSMRDGYWNWVKDRKLETLGTCDVIGIMCEVFIVSSIVTLRSWNAQKQKKETK
jgi:hypothetical protein